MEELLVGYLDPIFSGLVLEKSLSILIPSYGCYKWERGFAYWMLLLNLKWIAGYITGLEAV